MENSGLIARGRSSRDLLLKDRRALVRMVN
jgi:hypothetical protein